MNYNKENVLYNFCNAMNILCIGHSQGGDSEETLEVDALEQLQLCLQDPPNYLLMSVVENILDIILSHPTPFHTLNRAIWED